MKISFLIPCLRRGGAERQFIILAEALADLGHDVSFINYFQIVKENSYPTSIRKFIINKKIKIDLIFLIKLIRFVKKHRPDILYSCYQGIFEGPLLWARIVKIFCGNVKIISGIRSNHFSRLNILIEHLTSQLSSLIITNNNKAQKILINKCKVPDKKVVFISNIADTSKFYSLPQRKIDKIRPRLFKGNSKKFIVGHLGSYTKVKNHFQILKAAKYLKEIDKLNNIAFYCYGDKNSIGSQYSKINNSLIYYGLTDYIFLNDPLINVNEIINAVDLVVIPSFYEGCPNVAMETVLCNKPIVINKSANNSGLVVNGKNGIIIKNGDYFALSNAIIKLKNEKFNSSYSDNYLNLFHDKYGKNNIVKNYINIFDSLVQDNV